MDAAASDGAADGLWKAADAFPQSDTPLLGNRSEDSAIPTAAWKTLRVSHSSHSPDDDDLEWTQKTVPERTKTITLNRGGSTRSYEPYPVIAFDRNS